MGIGRPLGNQDPADFVLKPFSANERKNLELFVTKGANAIEALISEGLERAQANFNS
jgi:PTH1 family peptidyl-tRNA hydrolase